ncbi:MAG: glycosyltransferase family 39 protein [Prolixibacteraceae bacterium]|nr:glycosyltransferase family 39 protein [Prolixibacteraceae bacterium]
MIRILIVIFGIIVFVPGIGGVHLFDWDEINFAESAREMLVSGDYLTVQINFNPFWEKPPLFIWMQVLTMKIFGVNEFATRLPNAFCGIVTLLALFDIGKKIHSIQFGIIWTLFYACSFMPFFYFKSGIIDPWFNIFIFLGISFFIDCISNPDSRKQDISISLSAIFIGLSVLTKGPVGFLIFMLTLFVYLILIKFKIRFRAKHIIVFCVLLAAIGGFWFIIQIINGNFGIIREFIVYQIRLFQTEDAGHGGFLLYHFVILLLGVFPASVIALPVFHKSILKDEQNAQMKLFFQWMMILFWVVLILFTIVRTKIIHYSSMCYFPLTFFASWYVLQVFENKKEITKLIKIPLLVVAGIAAVLVALIPFFDKFKHLLYPYIDEFTLGNMQATASWAGFEWLLGVVLIAGAILFIVFLKSNKQKAFLYLLGGSLVVAFSATTFYSRQVEQYTQNEAIKFYQSRRGEDCYILSMQKSYAQYFYSDRQPANNNADRDFLQRGAIDKPCYFVVRNTRKNIDSFLSATSNPQKLYDKNGFAFFMRQPVE